MKRLKRTPLAILCMGAAALMVIAILHYRSQRSAARYLDELLARGEELEVQELVPEHAPEDATNATQLVARLAALPEEWVFSNRFPLLLEYFGPGRARVFTARAMPCQEYGTNTWADLDEALDHAAPALDAIAASLQNHSGFDFQFPYGPYPNKESFDPVSNFSKAAVWFQAAAMSNLRSRERAKAVRQIENIRRLADTLKTDRHSIIQRLRFHVARAGLDATWEALQAPGWTDSELAALQKIWEPSGYAVGMLRALEMERVMDLATLRRLRDADPAVSKAFFGHEKSSFGESSNTFLARFDDFLSSNAMAPLWNVILGEQAENHFLWHSQHLIDGIRLAVSRRSIQALRDASREYRRWRKSAGQLGLMRFMFSLFYLDDLTRTEAWAMLVETEREMAVAEIALRRFALRKGHPAATLKDLVPEFLPQVPVDFIDGQPLRYRAETGGNWVLYSVGEDGIDDGGNAEPKEDMVFWNGCGLKRVWHGRDAVWPKPAPADEVARFDAEKAARRAQSRQRFEEFMRAKTNNASSNQTFDGLSSPALPASAPTNRP